MEKKHSSPSTSRGPPPPPPSPPPPLDPLHGLQFGKKIYFEGHHHKSGAAETAEVPSPAKKGRSTAVQGGPPPRCQVEGCKVDLSDAKAYYCRHKVCGMHSKSPMVIVSGLHQRFCQQCSRFHQLPEFDQGKRSCRRRLAGHNERRRKPPPGSLLSPRYGTLSPSFFENPTTTRGFVMDFSSYPNPTLTGRDSNHQLPWPGYSKPGITGLGSSSEECFRGVSNNALSLLSNQPWASKARPPSLGVNNQFGTTMVQPSANPGAAVRQFAWGFKDNNQGNSVMRPVLGLGQTSSVLAQPNEGQFHELDHLRGYDSSIQHMHWSL